MTNEPEHSPRLAIFEVTTLLDAHFPQLDAPGKLFLIEDTGPGHATSAPPIRRPPPSQGRTISRPAFTHLIEPGGRLSVGKVDLHDSDDYLVTQYHNGGIILPQRPRQ